MKIRNGHKLKACDHLFYELETRLELATYGLQDRCATDCATPAHARNICFMHEENSTKTRRIIQLRTIRACVLRCRCRVRLAGNVLQKQCKPLA